MPAALIIVESCFGNTRTIADAVAAGIHDGGGQVRIIDVAHAPSTLPVETDLLLLGAPTHNRGLPTPNSRAQAYAQIGTAAPTGSMREWLVRAAVPAGIRVAAFDTVTSKSWLSGSAAKAIVKSLRRGRRIGMASARSFLVEGRSGPLGDGEEAAARAWGRGLSGSASNR